MKQYKVILEDEKGLKFKETINANSIIEVVNKINDTYYYVKNIQVFCVAMSFNVVFEYSDIVNDEIFKDMSDKDLSERLNDILCMKRNSFIPNLTTPISIVINGERYTTRTIEQICNIMNKYNLKLKESIL